MTDKEIIKALECCSKNSHELCALECPIFRTAGCIEELHKAVFVLINRQKEEIERYKGVIKILENDVQASRTEAVREFAEKLKESLEWRTEPIDDYDIDELVKEMVGEDDTSHPDERKENSNEHNKPN